MKNVKFLGIIALAAVIVFSMSSCLILGGGGISGGGSGGSSGSSGSGGGSANITDVKPGNVPQELVGRWFEDQRKRPRDFVFEITADGKFINPDNSAATAIAEGGVLRLVDNDGKTIVVNGLAFSWPYKVVGNTLYKTQTFPGLGSVEVPSYR